MKGKGKGRHRAKVLGAMALVLIAGCAGPATAPTASPPVADGSPASSAGPSVRPSQSIGPSQSPIALPSPATVPTEPPATLAPARTQAPTPKPTPKPQPTLDWAETPIGMSITPDPAMIGSKVKVTVSVASGPTCTIKVKYPSGSNASLPKPARPKATSWVWTWTIPQSSGAGTATVTTTCTYGGVARGGPSTFTIVNPTPSWSISVDLPSTHQSGTTNMIEATITVNGTLPENPEYAEQRLHCILHLEAGDFTANGGVNEYWDNGDGPINTVFPVGTVPAESIGTASWTVTCTALYLDPQQSKSDSGTIEIT